MIAINEFSKRSGFSVRMLRYIEEQGLLIPKRDDNNYRLYSQDQLPEIIRIKKLQNLGFQLREIGSVCKASPTKQIEIFKKVLLREQEIAEMKSDSVPELKNIIDYLNGGNKDFNNYFAHGHEAKRKMWTLGGEKKFHRVAYTIPILRTIYEDHITVDSNIKLIATDMMKFKEWFDNCDYEPSVFSILNESSFSFGQNLTEDFIKGYEKAWGKLLPAIGFSLLSDLNKEDVAHLMGPHDIIIRTTFSYQDTGEVGEIVIPYTPIYTMAQLSHSR